MDLTCLRESYRLDEIEWAMLPGERPREAGCNARLAAHGKSPVARIAKIRIGDLTGFGISRISKEQAQRLVGTPVKDMFYENGAVKEAFRALDFPLLDWLGKLADRSVYDMFNQHGGPSSVKSSIKVPCYDTTLYFDELHLTDNVAAIEWMSREAQDGRDRGHRNFKIKVGRGARWMETRKGLQRDIDIIRAIREVAGPEGKIMIDANNGYTSNMTKEVLMETKDCALYWIEEAFHEDRVLYEDLREWMTKYQITVKIADGEGQADPRLMEWARDKVIDIVQYDIINPGFSEWLLLGSKLDAWGAGSAPHSYGNIIGNYVNGHLAAAIKGFEFVEWDHAEVNGLDGSSYRIEDGFVAIPDSPGFGLQLDDAVFGRIRRDSGWVVKRDGIRKLGFAKTKGL
ncbi:enolase C-terminal domain-like protein [Paenibacillus allorhizosphaerae]|uniref:O-succinylbenzoate synthase n=1 Tax=Paenibacillus allorhizosphaerae TaxID=2849866 RepID=A0ABM8VE20_9BACL|nr:enolase C-terminal domain-like protein [Paenibacillus allorhizosphaerae]CAG7627558.1 o-succinylbenzoate synthase [Paenibacillus allorhizosphaerae]